jgi:queuine tRNA-ribosyltransferase
MEIQAALGSEIVMVFDECPPGKASIEVTKKSLDLTVRWAARSKARFTELQDSEAARFRALVAGAERDKSREELRDESRTLTGGDESRTLSGKQALFGIVQGASHLDLRKESLDRTLEIGFDGYAIWRIERGRREARDVRACSNTWLRRCRRLRRDI